VSDSRAALHARVQAESPLALGLEAVPLPGAYSLYDDEFVARTQDDWKMSAQPIVLTTQRLIFSAAQGPTVIRLVDIQTVRYRKSFIGHASVVVEAAGGGRIFLPAYINGEQAQRDIAAMIEFARRSSSNPSSY